MEHSVGWKKRTQKSTTTETTNFHSLKCQVIPFLQKIYLFFLNKNFQNSASNSSPKYTVQPVDSVVEFDDTDDDIFGGDSIALAQAHTAIAEAHDA